MSWESELDNNENGRNEAGWGAEVGNQPSQMLHEYIQHPWALV